MVPGVRPEPDEDDVPFLIEPDDDVDPSDDDDGDESDEEDLATDGFPNFTPANSKPFKWGSLTGEDFTEYVVKIYGIVQKLEFDFETLTPNSEEGASE